METPLRELIEADAEHYRTILRALSPDAEDLVQNASDPSLASLAFERVRTQACDDLSSFQSTSLKFSV